MEILIKGLKEEITINDHIKLVILGINHDRVEFGIKNSKSKAHFEYSYHPSPSNTSPTDEKSGKRKAIKTKHL